MANCTQMERLISTYKYKSLIHKYATAFEEKSVGGARMAVPIKNYTVPVALCVIGPSMRLAPKMMGLLNELIQSANNISEKLLKAAS